MCDMHLVIFLAKSYKANIAHRPIRLASVDVRYASCDFAGQELQNKYRTSTERLDIGRYTAWNEAL